MVVTCKLKQLKNSSVVHVQMDLDSKLNCLKIGQQTGERRESSDHMRESELGNMFEVEYTCPSPTNGCPKAC